MPKNQMFTEMKKAAVARLMERNPLEIARTADVQYENGAFRLESLGKTVVVGYPSGAVAPSLAPWWELTLLHYLAQADGAPLTGRLLAFGALKDGMARGMDFDRKAEAAMRNCVSSPEKLRQRCAELGGAEIAAAADYAVRLPFLPRYPVTLQIWFADEEFAASGRLLLDESAGHYLGMEDAVTVGELLLELLFAK